MIFDENFKRSFAIFITLIFDEIRQTGLRIITMAGVENIYFLPNIYRIILPELSDAGNFRDSTELILPILSKSNSIHSGGSFSVSDFSIHLVKITESRTEVENFYTSVKEKFETKISENQNSRFPKQFQDFQKIKISRFPKKSKFQDFQKI